MSDKTKLEPSKVQAIAQKVNEGNIDLKDLVKELAPEPEHDAPDPSEAPLPVITDEQREALALVPKVFGSVVLDERRQLTTEELFDLYEERGTLDTVEKMAAARKSDIREYLLTHSDLDAEEDEGLGRDKDGHVARKARYPIDGTDQDWSLEPRAGSSSLNPEKLKALAADPEFEALSHEDYLACTSRVRVFDEHKFMLLLKKKPALLEVISEAMEPTGKPSITVTTRKHKR